MKTLSDSSFFRTFDLLVGASNPRQKLDNWTIDDAVMLADLPDDLPF